MEFKKIIFFTGIILILTSSLAAQYKWILDDTDTPWDGTWDYGSVWEAGAPDTTLENISGTIITETNIVFRGTTAVKLHFYSVAGSYAGVALKADDDNNGTPPEAGEEDLAKNVNAYECLSLWIKGDTNSDAFLYFKDTDNDESARTNLRGFIDVQTNWQLLIIRKTDIRFNSAELTKLKEIQFRLNNSPTLVLGDYTFYIDNMVFTTILPETPGPVHPKSKTSSSIKVAVNPVNNATSYTLFRSTSNDSNTAVSVKGFDYQAGDYTDNDVAKNTTYYYWVKAYNIYGESSFSTVRSISLSDAYPIPYYLKWAFNDTDSPLDNAWNYSYLSSQWGTSSIEWSGTDIPTDSVNVYEGSTAIKLHYNFDGLAGSGALGFIVSDPDKDGTPPDYDYEMQTGKDISLYEYLSFYIKGDTNSDAMIEIMDTEFKASTKFHLTNYVKVTQEWQFVKIPYKDIDWGDCDKTSIKAIQVIVEDGHGILPGDFTFYLDSIAFSSYKEVDENKKITVVQPNYIRAYPNYLTPDIDEADLVFYINNEGDVTIQICDEFGSLIWTHKQHYTRGVHSKTWTRPELGSGVYLVYLRIRDDVSIGKIVVIK